MELTDKQIKDLKKFSLIMNSLNYEDGLIWEYKYYDDEWERLDGPTSKRGGNADELGFLPQSILEILESLRDNFDTDLFYNEYYDNYYGGLEIGIYPNDQEIRTSYFYQDVKTEDHLIERTFHEMSETANPWRRGENVLKKLENEETIQELKDQYGPWVRIRYDGGGDSGYLDEVQSESGNGEINGIIEDIGYEALEIYFAGWEVNEGSSGWMEFNFDNKTFQIEHYQNIEDIETEEYKTISFK